VGGEPNWDWLPNCCIECTDERVDDEGLVVKCWLVGMNSGGKEHGKRELTLEFVEATAAAAALSMLSRLEVKPGLINRLT